MKKLFILGAGASCEYGFATGCQLIEEIANILHCKDFEITEEWPRNRGNDDIPNLYIITLMLAMRFPEEKLQMETCFSYVLFFYKKFISSGTRSIDDFLMTHEKNKYFTAIGKILIVLAIGSYERKGELYNFIEKKDGEKTKLKSRIEWYSYFWQYIFKETLDATLDELAKYYFITFNYERSFENFIFQRLRNMFDIEDAELTQKLFDKKCFNVFHVYGKLGLLKWQTKNKMGSIVDYGSASIDLNEYGELLFKALQALPADYRFESSIDDLFLSMSPGHFIQFLSTKNEQLMRIVDISKNIKIYHESSEELTEKIQTDNICFLGFGYHNTNLEKLKNIIEYKNTGNRIYGTTYGFSEAEFSQVIVSLQSHYVRPEKIKKEDSKYTVLDYLKNVHGAINA